MAGCSARASCARAPSRRGGEHRVRHGPPSVRPVRLRPLSAQQGRRCQPEGCPVLLAAPAREDGPEPSISIGVYSLLRPDSLEPRGCRTDRWRDHCGNREAPQRQHRVDQHTPTRYRTVQPSHDPPTPLGLDHDLGCADERPRRQPTEWHGSGSGRFGRGPRRRAVHRSRDRQPAIVVQATPGQFKAFSALCTHGGCTSTIRAASSCAPATAPALMRAPEQ